jgi:uncharacterized membrane protein
MARQPAWTRKLMTPQDLDAVTQAVREAESRTSAEIRVHLDHRCLEEPLARAAEVFHRLGMHRTALRNGALIYVAIEDHKLAVIGDVGIHDRVGQAYWERLVADIAADLRTGRPRDGLVGAVRELSRMLATCFPRQPGDINELPDRVSLE